MWELLAIARAHNYERWKHTSSVVWAAFQSQSAETIDPRVFHPMIARRKVRSRGQTLRPHQVRLESDLLRAREAKERSTLTSPESRP